LRRKSETNKFGNRVNTAKGVYLRIAATLAHQQTVGLLKRDAVLINTARGGLIDEHALAAMLRQGKLGGAALDVFEQEPLPKNSHLAQVPGLLLTPHIAGVTLESNERVSTMIAREVSEALLKS